jgi:hypothetical protein
MKRTETWKDVPGYDGAYQISDHGRIRSVPRKVNNGNGFRMSDSLIMKQYDNGHGYLRVCLSNGVKKKFTLVHRLIAENFLPNLENMPIVNHIDGDKRNNDLSNLEWCDSSYNNQHAFDNKLIKPLRGERHKKAKLTELEVLDIKLLLDSGSLKQTEIAKLYKVHPNTINGIKTKSTWKHLK